MTTTQRNIDSKSVKAIMSGRTAIPADANGRTYEFIIQGAGNVIDVKTKDGQFVQSVVNPELVLQKKIFNVRANSQLAMGNKRNVDLLINGIKAEKAAGKVKGFIGDAEGEYSAHEYFNAYLNAVQMSVGILLPSAKADQLADGVRISGTCELITTENGSVMTIAQNSISILAPEKAAKTTFNVDDFLPADMKEPAVAPVAVTGTEVTA